MKARMVDPEAVEIRRWIERYTNENMKRDYLKFLEEYCIFWDKTPSELLEIKSSQKEAEAEKMLDDFVILWKEPKTYTARTDEIPDSVKLIAVRAVRSFYSANYQDLAKRAGSGVQQVAKKVTVAPTQDQLRELCVGRNLRDIALINFLSSTGVRGGTLRKLTWGHVLPELENWDGHIPIHIGIRSKELKGRGRGRYRNLEQHTFLTPHATRALLDYTQWREMRGETMSPDSPLFTPVLGEPGQISDRDLRAIFERACERHPFKFSPHDLRRFTQTQLEAARVQPNWIRKMLGKTVKGEEAPYSRPKIEQLREAFRAATPYLTLAPIIEDDSDRKIAESLVAIAKGMGASEDMINKFHEMFISGGMSLSDFQREITGIMRNLRQKEQMIVEEEDLPNHLSHGWVFVGTTPSGRCIVERKGA